MAKKAKKAKRTGKKSKRKGSKKKQTASIAVPERCNEKDILDNGLCVFYTKLFWC